METSLIQLKFTNQDRILIIGPTGSGKTELALRIARAYRRRIVWSLDWETKLRELGEVKKITEWKQINYGEVSRPNTVIEPNTACIVHFNRLCEYLFYYRADVLFYIEEVHEYAPLSTLLHNLELLLRRGRKHALPLLMTTQELAGLNKLVLRQSNHIFCFRSHEVNQNEFLRKMIGVEGYEIIRDLKQYESAYFNAAQQTTVKIPALHLER